MSVDPRIPISKAFETPANDETPEVEGHAFKAKAFEQPSDDASEEAEVEGHGYRRFGTEQAVEQPSDDDAEVEVEGHLRYTRWGAEQAVEQPVDADASEEAEVEGHGYKRGAFEQPADGDDEPTPGDTESAYKKI